MASFIKIITKIISTLVIFQIGLAEPLNSSLFELSIIHINDFHSRYIPISPTKGLCYEFEREKCIGGLARISTMANRLKSTRKNAIFLNAGDTLQGTLYFDVHRARMAAYFMNKLPHDVMTIGNHDFDDGLSGLEYFGKTLTFPTVVANIDFSEEPTLQNIFPKSTVLTRGDKKIGIIGVTTTQINRLIASTGRLKFLDAVSSINAEAEKLKSKGVSHIIVLSHCGISKDRAIATSCPNVDVIVGGHTHLFFYNGTPPSGDFVSGTYPVVINQRGSDRKVLIVHSGSFSKYIGDIQISFDDAGEIVRWKGNPIYLNKTVEEDPDIVRELEPWKIDVDRVANRSIGRTEVFLNGTACSRGECNMANLITDAMLDCYGNEATISLFAAHYIQNNIPPGPITYGHVYMTLPFNQTWHLVEMKGSALLQVIENNAARIPDKVNFEADQLYHWSGMKVVYNLNNKHNKVISAKIRCRQCSNATFETLDEEASYKIIAPTYLLGRNGIRDRHLRLATGKTGEIDNLISYIGKFEKITIRKDSRMIFV